MENSPSDRLIWLEAEYRRLSELLDRLDEVIGDLESAPFLKRDPAVRLDKYRQNRERQQFARKKVQLEIQRLATGALATTLHDELLEQVREKGHTDREPLGDLFHASAPTCDAMILLRPAVQSVTSRTVDGGSERE